VKHGDEAMDRCREDFQVLEFEKPVLKLSMVPIDELLASFKMEEAERGVHLTEFSHFVSSCGLSPHDLQLLMDLLDAGGLMEEVDAQREAWPFLKYVVEEHLSLDILPQLFQSIMEENTQVVTRTIEWRGVSIICLFTPVPAERCRHETFVAPMQRTPFFSEWLVQREKEPVSEPEGGDETPKLKGKDQDTVGEHIVLDDEETQYECDFSYLYPADASLVKTYSNDHGVYSLSLNVLH
jgi:hypothetical protein